MSEMTPTWQHGEIIDGRYKILTALGQGGMGVVYQVRHLEWDIDLAVKCPRPELFREAEAQRRFVDEAETWVDLGLHPNVCNCFYVRVLDGVPRVFAEYVPGGSLDEWIKRGWLYDGKRSVVLARILDVAIQTAWGLDHAHSRGLVHRDVKPGNVLLDTDGEHGTVIAKVTDFGLARARAMAATLNPDAPPGVSILVPGGSGMTPLYASPEQADSEPVGRRTDIYSLAVSLLEMCVGEVTWMTGPAADAALAGYRAGDMAGTVVMPRALGDLLEQCLHHNPDRRPKSMADVATELIDIYQGVIGHTYPRPVPTVADLRADEFNNRAVSLLDLDRHAEAGEAFTAALAADPRHLEATYNDGLRQWRTGAITDEELISRLEAARTASGDPWLARYLLAEVHMERGDLTAARELLRTVEHMAPRHSGVASALRVARSGRLADSRCVATRTVIWHEYKKWMTFSDGQKVPCRIPVMEIRFTADGGRALAVSGANVGLWDVHSGQCLVRLTKQIDGEKVVMRASLRVDISTDGGLALCGERNEVWLRDLNNGRELWRARTDHGSRAEAARDRTGNDHGHLHHVVHVALGADAGIAAVLIYDVGMMIWQIWDAHTGRLRSRLGQHTGVAESQLSPDGRFLLNITHGDGTARLWDTGTGACIRELHGINQAVSAMAISADGRTAAIARYGGNISIWDLTTGRVHTLTGHAGWLNSLAWSNDGRLLLAGGSDGTVRLWKPDSGRCLRTFPITLTGEGTIGPRALLFESASGRVAAASEDMVRWWTLPSHYIAPPQLSKPRKHAELRMLETRVADLLNRARRASDSRAALELLAEARAVPGHEREPQLLAVWRELGRSAVRIGLRSAWPSGVFDADGNELSLALSRNGRIAVSGGTGDTVRVWNMDSGTCLREIELELYSSGVAHVVDAVGVSGDGSRVMCAHGETITVWSVESGERITVLSGDGGWLRAAFDRAGRSALIAGHDAIRLWNLDTGVCERELSAHHPEAWIGVEGRVGALWLGSELAASAGLDKVVRLWDLTTGQCRHALRGHTGSVMSVCLSPDDRYALSAGGHTDWTIRLWDTATGECLRVFGHEPDHPRPDHPRGVNSVHEGRSRDVRFSPDGRFAISGEIDTTVRIWEVATGRCLHILDGHRDRVNAVLISADARFALSASADGTIRRWELDWEFDARDAADWDEGAAPYLNAFLRRHGPQWTGNDFDALLHRLQDAGYGWLRTGGVRAQLERMAAGTVR